MALFRRRRRLHAPLIDFGGLPNLADGIDDNLYLASAAKAAEIDFKSGAYDKFLFSEDGLRRMPYEVAIESHLALINQRLADAGRRQSLRREAAVLDLETKISKAEAKLDRNDKQIENIESQIVYEESILSGLTQGIDNADWRDPKPQLASRLSIFMRIAAPIITLIVASLVDLAIIQASLDSIPGFKFVEAWMFTAPAVAMQVVFPHLIGLRLGRILRNSLACLCIRSNPVAHELHRDSSLKRWRWRHHPRARSLAVDQLAADAGGSGWMVDFRRQPTQPARVELFETQLCTHEPQERRDQTWRQSSRLLE